MRLASLFSGGKDSVFSLYTAEQMGHEVPYIVNIVPEDSASWIFHTPKLNCVPLFADAMGKELVTGHSTGEEGSDMEGLREALDGLDIDGVVSGAVWSDYQWDRMNMVCGDLGLTFLAPMWRKDQDMLLDAIVSSGVEAYIVGTYAEGFDASWLGRKIDTDCVRDLKELRRKYGISIMGEGGEYESIVLDSPLYSHGFTIGEADKESGRTSGTLRIRSLLPKGPTKARIW
jgi:ABC transporter with metal-binding/Fe-S-binding domain ATP-binding protein